MKTKVQIKKFLSLSLLLIYLTISAAAQDSARLQVRVVDPNGAIVAGAVLTLTGDNQNRQFTFTADEQGQYIFAGIPPGNYSLSIKAQGFAELTRQIEIKSSEAITLDVALQITISERIDVRLVEDNLTAITLSGDKLAALPSDPRQLLLRLQRLAGAGGNPNDLIIYVDGFREDGKLPPKETIAAIRINADPFSAEFPEPGRARVEIITKPATERFRGELNFYFADESLNARNSFARERAPLQMRNFSGAFSGPIKRERWGYFLEFSRNSQEDNALINALTINPTTFQPFPFNATVSTPARTDAFSVRTSRLFGKTQTFDARYGFVDTLQRNQGLDSSFDLPERSVSTNWRENSLRFSLLSVLSENSFNEARLSLSRKRYRAEAVNQNYAILVFDFFNAGGNQESLFLDEASRNLRAENNFTRIAGKHSLKLGVSASAISYESTDRSNFGGTFIFGSDFERNDRGFPVSIYSYISPLESYQLTLLRRVGYRPLQFSINQGDPFASLKQWDGAIFAQDDWRVSGRLTVSLGLRAETQTNLKGVNFAPRAALAVRPFKNVESVLRVGAGIFYSRVDSGITLDAIRYDGSRVEELVVQRPPFFPTVPAVLNRAVALTTIRTKSPDLTAPYNFISTISYWQQLSKNFNATISYNWQRGVHLLRTRNVNAPIPGTNNVRPNDALGAILQYESTGNLKRHEFNFGLQGSLTDKFSFYGNYRLAFADSDTDGAKTAAANSYDLTSERGRSAFDQRHQFYFESYVQLPFGIYFSPNVFIASGAPFNILTGRDDNGDTLFTDRPAFANPGDAGALATRFGTFNLNPQAGDRIIPRNYGRGASQISINFNLSKTFFFGAEKGGQNAPVNQGNCRSGVLQKVRCGLDRRYGLTFSADVYNVINRTNFIEFNNVVTSPKFGLPNRAADARRFQLGLSLSF